MTVLGPLGALVQLLLDSAPVLAGGALVLAGFIRLERCGRRETTLVVLLAVLALDVGLFPTYGTTQGLFQPTVLGRSLSLTAVLSVVAVLARLLVAGRGPRVVPAAALWLLFLVWTAVAGARGLLAGHPSQNVLYEALVVLHVGGFAVIAGTTPWSRLVARSGLPLLASLTAPLAALLCLTDTAGVRLTAGVPVLGALDVGSMGADAATVFASVGLLSGALAMSRPVGERAGLLPAAVLLAAPLVAQQRAGVLGLGVGLAVVALGVLLQGRARALRLLSGEVVLGLLVASALGAAALAGATLAGAQPGLPSALADSINGTAKQQSGQSRLNQWSEATDVIQTAPVQGLGLGTSYRYFEVGPDELRESEITHNVLLDVTMRSGLIGLALLLAAVVASTLDAWRTTRTGPVPARRALALGALAVLAGLLAKGVVESVFEKHRLAVLVGVAVGLCLTAGRDRHGVPDGTERDTDLEASGSRSTTTTKAGRAWT